MATVSWEHGTQIVGEADGVTQVCGSLIGKLETNLPAISVRALSGTAIQGHGIVKKTLLYVVLLSCKYHILLLDFYSKLRFMVTKLLFQPLL